MTPEIRLIAVDMDGTLLDPAGRIPGGLWELLGRLHGRGIAFAPASGRQLATLQAMFGHLDVELDYIAENGAYVLHGGVEVSSDAMDPDVVASIIGRLRALAEDSLHIGVVLCGKRSAYIESTEPAFVAETEKYYKKLETTDDLLAVDDQVLKIAVFDFDGGEQHTAPAIDDLRATHQVVVSGQHWVDIMNQGVDKGKALRSLQRAMGITPAQTMAFGDYLNDLEMLRSADWSYAMADAHPDVVAVANHRAGSNADGAVLKAITDLLD